jgi:hypothetical protein
VADALWKASRMIAITVPTIRNQLIGITTERVIGIVRNPQVASDQPSH